MTFEYKEVLTGDGSPTLSLGPSWEHMHALEGAFTETLYIYRSTVRKAFEAALAPVFLSLGLGLGYNEMLIAFESIKRGVKPSAAASYESVPELREAFAAWITEKPSVLGPVYDRIGEMYSKEYSEPLAAAKSLLRGLLETDGLRFCGGVETSEVFPSHAILFDPFSTKTSPSLWTPAFLEGFFHKAAAVPCFVSTYACNGTLKRALKKNGFTLDIQKGFGMKRQSTFAWKIGAKE